MVTTKYFRSTQNKKAVRPGELAKDSKQVRMNVKNYKSIVLLKVQLFLPWFCRLSFMY